MHELLDAYAELLNENAALKGELAHRDQAKALAATTADATRRAALHKAVDALYALTRNPPPDAMKTRNHVAHLSALVAEPLASHLRDGVRAIDRALETQAINAWLRVPMRAKERVVRGIVIALCVSARHLIDNTSGAG